MLKDKRGAFRSVKFKTEVRAEEGGKKLILRGYPIVFNSPTKVYDWLYGEITEVILPNALDGLDLSNVYLLVGHNPDNVLGRTGVNMRLWIDETGLGMECELPNTQYARDWYNLIESGIVDGMSIWFEFGDKVNPETLTRTITKISALYEVTITPFPAYKETVVIAANDEDKADDADINELLNETENILKNWED